VYVIKRDSQGRSIKMAGSDGITFNASSYTILYLEGTADIGGNGISNVSSRPSNLQIFGMPTCTAVKIAGNGNFHGVVYAPQADITLNGGGNLGAAYGSLAGKTVSFNGNGTFLHYDESLRQMTGVIRDYKLHSWTQLR
jgi:choice-of-anchor A domain-containing protein